MLQRRKKARPYWLHILWMANVLLLIVVVWYIAYRWRAAQNWPFFLFLWLLVQPTLLYCASCILFPDQEDRETISDWRVYFFDNHRRVFLLLALNFPLDLIDTSLKGAAHFRAQGPGYLGGMLVMMSLCLVGAFTRNRRYHAFFAIFFLATLLTLVGVTSLTDQGMIGGWQ